MDNEQLRVEAVETIYIRKIQADDIFINILSTIKLVTGTYWFLLLLWGSAQ